jgi:putative glutamine amidotransferase
MKRYFSLILIALWLSLSISVAGQTRIAFSKYFESYETWLRKADPGITAVNMYGLYVDSALMLLQTCSGLLITGGEDVHPGNYGKLKDINRCEDIDQYRDSIEFALIKKAVSLKMPVFGICRGEQILNVALGGTLYVDIPSDIGKTVIHRCNPGSFDCLHKISIEPGSLLYQITKVSAGIVNSWHHQAVEKVAPGMKVSAFTIDRVVEAIEKANLGGPFIMGVQWHPEKLRNNPEMTDPLAVYFMNQAKIYRDVGQRTRD